jgi:type I restriction enzyme S subunit
MSELNHSQEIEKLLPDGWIITNFDNSFELIDGDRGTNYPKKHDYLADGECLFLSTKNVREFGFRFVDTVFISKEKHKILRSGTLRIGDLVLTTRGTLGNIAYYDKHNKYATVRINSGMLIVRPVSHDIYGPFVERYIFSNAFKKQVESKSTGSAQPQLPAKILKTFDFVLPSLAEQKEIVAQFDKHLAQVESTKKRLDAIPAILKSFRQSVLAAAVSGKLTEEWRGGNEYYKTDFGFDIPESWALQTIDDVAHIKGGKRLPKGEELLEIDTSFRYIRAGQLKNGTVINGVNARNKQLFISSSVYDQIKRYTISKGDAYLTIVGASIGDAGIVPPEFDGANLTENAAKICEFKQQMCSAYIGYWLRSQHIQDLIQLEIKSGAQGKLALMRIKTLPFPKVSFKEQTEIVRRVDELFAYANKVEAQVNAAQERVNNLTQSILAKAFSGELTAKWRAQNSDLITGENSAAALLEKIKAERTALAGKNKPAKKTTARKAKA